MSVSEFRRNKLLYVFNVFFDVNQSGTVEEKDFEMAIEKICCMRGWNQGNTKYEETKERLLKVWDGLRQNADSNNDDQISRDEWVAMWGKYAKGSNSTLEWQQRYMEFMFDLEDTSGDGSIDEKEFTEVCTAYGISTDECTDAFRKLSSNGSTDVTREAFGVLWKEYFSSDDPAAPGNFIFGKTNFD